ncbi:MAG: hypothetical protein U0869_02340 [Chloroflexota bacterium]
MFNIHNFRQQELMLTALSLQSVMADLQSDDPVELANLTGLNSKTVQRCLLIGSPERFQSLSLDPNPKSRVPANFWIESDPVIRLVRDELPAVWTKLGYEGILDALVGKYQRRRIRSVIDFRRIVEAHEGVEARCQAVLTSLDHYVTDPEAEIRSTFDQYIVDSRLAQTVLGACRSFIERVSEPGVVDCR